MKRPLALISITAVLIGIFPTYAGAASVVANGKCTKLGATAVSGGKTYTCIKSGSKLVWNKGVVIVKTVPTRGPTATPVPTVPKALIPISLPVSTSGEITFANAASNYTKIPGVAWQRIQDVIAANPSVDIPTTIDIGPNTKADEATIKNSLSRLYRLFAGFSHFSSYIGIVYNAKDLAWAQSDAATQFQKMGITGFMKNAQAIKQQSEAGCEINGTTPIECSGGMALTFKDGGSNAGGSFYGVQNTYTGNGHNDDYWTAPLKYVGPMTQVTHEGTHNYQFAQFFNTPFSPGQNTASDQSHAFTPWWYSEGQANGIGIGVFAESLSDYVNMRNPNVTRQPDSRAKPPAMTAEALKKFLTEYQPTGPENSNWSLAYSVGYATVEALIAIGGPQATLALYALGANGENWDTAFKHVYGISWDEAATYLSQVLAAEYAAKPLGS